MSEAIQLDFRDDGPTRPLYDTPPIIIQRQRADLTLKERIAYMGTCGAPGEFDYRDDMMTAVHDRFAQNNVDFTLEEYSPRVAEWHPRHAIAEKRSLAESRFVVLPALNTTPGQATTAEIGFGLIGSILRGQEILLYVDPGYEHGKRVVIGRQIVLSYLKNIQPLQQGLGSHLCDSLQDLTDRVATTTLNHVQAQNANHKSGPAQVTLDRPELIPRIVVSGSGAWSMHDEILRQVPRRYSDLNQVRHTYSLGFDQNATRQIQEEINLKTTSAVNLVSVKGDAELTGYGAVNEVGLLVASTVLRNQSLGLYIEKHDSDDNSPSNRQRVLVASHLARLMQDFPDLTTRIMVASSIEELAEWGRQKLDEHLRWRQVIGI